MMVLLVLAAMAALALDLALGDPGSRWHPTAWVGALIARLAPRARCASPRVEKLRGTAVLVAVAAPVAFLAYLAGHSLSYLWSLDLGPSRMLVLAASAFAAGLLLKTTIAVRGMQEHTSKVMASLASGDLEGARSNLALIVKRPTRNLDKQHVISATLESISENIVDGITGPLFYFSFFGLIGAFVYRTINTADSMVGYKTDIFRNVGWFAANCDKALNFLPSRLTSIVMILSCIILKKDWRHSIHIMKRDGPKTESPNAGYPMATLAGALGI